MKAIKFFIFLALKRLRLVRHAREGGHPWLMLVSQIWIPASAGMTFLVVRFEDKMNKALVYFSRLQLLGLTVNPLLKVI